MPKFEACHVLSGLRHRLEELRFEVKEKDGVRYINSFDRAFGFIDDTLIIVNDLIFQPSTGSEERDALTELGNVLQVLNDVLEKLGRCQNQVFFLYPLFKDTEEGRVLHHWEDIMHELERHGFRAKMLADEEWSEKVSGVDHNFKNLCLGLGELVSARQTSIDRLYFCSTEEVLAIVSSPTVSNLQPFFRALFGFHSVSVTYNDVITHLCSDDGEVVELMDPVDTKDRALADWLAELERQMRRTVIASACDCAATFFSSNIRSWAADAPALSMLLGAKIAVTRSIETTFKHSAQIQGPLKAEKVRKDFTKLLAVCEGAMRELSDWINKGNRRARVRHLLNIFCKATATITALLSEKVLSRSHLTWQKCLRWYAELQCNDMSEPECLPPPEAWHTLIRDNVGAQEFRITAQQLQSVYEFDGEYAPMLNRTILPREAEEALAVVLHAFHMKHVGCLLYEQPSTVPGVAAFSPSDFVLEAAQMLGKKWRRVLCDKECTHACIARIMKGAFASGTWLLFQDINLLDPAVLAVVHDGASAIQYALRNNSDTYQFEGAVLPVMTTSFALFGTLSAHPMDPITQHGIEKIKHCLTPLAVSTVPLEAAIKLQITLLGHQAHLSHQISDVLHRAVVSKSFGLNPSVGVTELTEQFMAIFVKVTEVVPDVNVAVVNALYKVFLRQIPETRTSQFMDLVQSCLGVRLEMTDTSTSVGDSAADGSSFAAPAVAGPLQQVPLSAHASSDFRRVAATEHYVANDTFMRKCSELYEAAACAETLALVGPTAAGKTAVWRTVHQAMFPTAVAKLIFSRLYNKQTFFGCVDQFNEWVDGPFTHIFRQISTSPEAAVSAEQHWIVIDGAPDDDILAELLPLMRGKNRCLTLATGEIIRAPSTLRIVFELSGEEEFSPAIATKCSLVYVEPTMLSARELIAKRVADPSFYLASFKAKAADVLLRLVPSVADWASQRARSDWTQDKDPSTSALAYFPLNISNLIASCFNVINGFKNKRKTSYNADEERSLTESMVEPVIMFACVWSLGSVLGVTHDQRVAFNQYFRNLVIDKGLLSRFPMPLGDELGLVFDYVYDVETREWLRWASLPTDAVTAEADDPLNLCHQLARTPYALRLVWLLQHLTDKGTNILLCGPPASAKAALMERSLRHYVSFYCSGTTHKHMEATVGAKLQKSVDNVIRLPDRLDRPIMLLMEGLELANRSSFEFIRQLRDNGGWFDTYSNEQLAVHDVAFAATVDCRGILPFSERELQAFHYVSVPEMQPGEMVGVVESMLNFWFRTKHERPTTRACSSPATEVLIAAAGPAAQVLVEVYGKVVANFSSKKDPRFTWTDGVLEQLLLGLTAASPQLIVHVEDFIRLLINECLFCFGSRLEPHSEDATWVEEVTWVVVLKYFPQTSREGILKQRKTICYGGLRSEYRDYKDPGVWRDAVVAGSERYAATMRADDSCHADQIVLQDLLTAATEPGSSSVLQNMTKLLRCLRVRSGHILLLTDYLDANIAELTLASHLHEAHLFRPQLSAFHTFADWRDILKNICFTAFVSSKPCIIVLDEHNLPDDCLKDVAALVKRGEIVGLFTQNDWKSLTLTVDNMLEARGDVLQSKEHIKDLVRSSLLSSLSFVVVRCPRTLTFAKVVSDHVILQTHFYMVSLESTDSDHLRLVTSAPATPFSDTLPTHVLSVSPTEHYVRVIVLLFNTAKDAVRQSESFGEHALFNVDIASGSVRKMWTLSQCVVRELRSTNKANQMKFERCLSTAQASADPTQWVRCIRRWQAVSADLEDEWATIEGDALLFACCVTWTMCMADNSGVIKQFQTALRSQGIVFTEAFAVSNVYERMHLRSDLSEWADRGLFACHVSQCIAMKHSPASVVTVLDPQTIALSSLRASNHGKIIAVAPPFRDNILHMILEQRSKDVVIVLSELSEADLQTHWLRAAVQEIQGAPGKTKATCSKFRLVLVLDAQDTDIRLCPFMRTSTTVVSFGLHEDRAAKALSAAIRDRTSTSDDVAEVAATRSVYEAELALSAAVSGAGVGVAKREAVLPQLLASVDDAVGYLEELQIQKEENDSQTLLDPVTANAYERLARSYTHVMLAAFQFAQLVPTSRFSPNFFCDTVRAFCASSAEKETDLAAWHTTGLRYLYEKVASSSALSIRKLQLLWLLTMEFTKDSDRAAVQRVLFGVQPDDLAKMSLRFVNPAPHWLASCCLLHLNSSGYPELLSRIAEDASKSQAFFQNKTDLGPNAPAWYADLGMFSKLSLARHLRPDWMHGLMQRIGHEVLGLNTSFDSRTATEQLSSFVHEVTALQPLMVVSDKARFMSAMKQVVADSSAVDDVTGREESMVRKTFFVGSAHSQKTMARSLIADAVREGNWIVITDLMVSQEFCRELDAIVQALRHIDTSHTNPHPNFKLIIQTKCQDGIPKALIESCTKLGLARVDGVDREVRECVHQLRAHFENPASTSRLSKPDKIQLFSQVLPRLILFHALVMEWQGNKHRTDTCEAFTLSDLEESVRCLVLLLHTNSVNAVTYPLLRHILGRIMYGARLPCAADIEKLEEFANMTLRSSNDDTIVFGNHVLPMTQQFVTRLDEWKVTPDETAKLIGRSDTAVSRLRRIQNTTVLADIASVLSSSLRAIRFHQHDSEVQARCAEVSRRLPPLFDLSAAFAWLPEPLTPVLKTLGSLLLDELTSYNSIIGRVGRDICRVTKAHARIIEYDDHITAVVHALLSSRVPVEWLIASGVGTVGSEAGSGFFEPDLWAWLAAVRDGYEFFRVWSVEGTWPSIVNVQAFINPAALLQAGLNEFCMSSGIPAVDVKMRLCPVSDATSPLSNCTMYVAELFIKGAVWNRMKQCLEECSGQFASKLPLCALVCSVNDERKPPPDMYKYPQTQTAQTRRDSSHGHVQERIPCLPPGGCVQIAAHHAAVNPSAISLSEPVTPSVSELSIPVQGTFSPLSHITRIYMSADSALSWQDPAISTRPW
ncbi:Dynein heavy chain [Diplonema papillatum]|nr:Dynein heavy chain [Diplonema papillatum]